MRAKLRIISQIVFAFHFLGVFGSIAQNQADDYSGLSIKLICPRREVIAGENFAFQIVISNSATQRFHGAPAAFMVYLDVVIQQDGPKIPYQIKYQRSGLGPDLEIEANGTWRTEGDLYEGWPSGIPVGNLTLFASYSPNRTNRNFKIKSNTIQLTVLPRSPQQEAEYNDYHECPA